MQGPRPTQSKSLLKDECDIIASQIDRLILFFMTYQPIAGYFGL